MDIIQYDQSNQEEDLDENYEHEEFDVKELNK